MAKLNKEDKKLLEEVLSISGDDPKEISDAVKKVIGRHFSGPRYNGTRGYYRRLLISRAKDKISRLRANADRAHDKTSKFRFNADRANGLLS